LIGFSLGDRPPGFGLTAIIAATLIVTGSARAGTVPRTV
jgi:hypothetical protein